jgi:putative ABC transport system permease protein
LSGWLDRWREILETMGRRRLRTALTALSVAWGIFMLVVLLAAGQGLSTGAETEFARDAMNSVWVFPFRTSKPHKGTPIGTWVRIDNEDYRLAGERVEIEDQASAVVGLNGRVRRGKRNASFSIMGVHPDFGEIERSDIVEGRYLNPDDQRLRRKVGVIGVKVRQLLFDPGEPAAGETIEISGIPFQVVGVFDEENEQDQDLQVIHVPVSTAQLLFTWGGRPGEQRAIGNRLERFVFTVGNATGAETDEAIDDMRAVIAGRKDYAADDTQALRVFNNQAMYERFRRLFTGIRTFVWLIGLGTILAGVVGVSNIMLISVQERTREIGLRKAVGAQPRSIIAMILQEAMAITMVSGYLGLCAGVALVTFAQKVIPPTPFFKRPDVDIGVGLAATGVLVICGMLAGLFPALRAARVNPIAALRVE